MKRPRGKSALTFSPRPGSLVQSTGSFDTNKSHLTLCAMNYFAHGDNNRQVHLSDCDGDLNHKSISLLSHLACSSISSSSSRNTGLTLATVPLLLPLYLSAYQVCTKELVDQPYSSLEGEYGMIQKVSLVHPFQSLAGSADPAPQKADRQWNLSIQPSKTFMRCFFRLDRPVYVG